MPHELYLIRLIHHPTRKAFPGERLWTAAQLASAATVRFLRVRNCEGCDVYIQPCPDVCPLHMANVAVALKKLSAGVADHVKLVFVTTDPARDSAKALRSWLDHFDKGFIGLTGTEAAIEAAQLAAGLPAAKKSPLANGDYGVGHSSFVLVYSKDNLAHLIYPGGMSQQDWAHDLPHLVREPWAER